MAIGLSRRTAGKMLAASSISLFGAMLPNTVKSMTDEQISAADPHPRQRVRALDAEISYVDIGTGLPIVPPRESNLFLSLAECHSTCE
jgi:hypothetical protein